MNNKELCQLPDQRHQDKSYLGDITVKLEEGQRQMMLMAIADLSLRNPGWDWTLGKLATTLQGYDMYNNFRELRADLVHRELP